MKQTILLLEYLNEHPLTDTFSKVIIYIFKHKAKIPTMTITELADKTYVTPSTITRFCKFFGFRAFAELKEAIQIEIQTDPTRLFRLTRKEFSSLSSQPSISFEAYGQAIIDSIQDTLETVQVDMLDQLIELLNQHEQVAVFGYSSSIRTARSLQEGLILANKLTYVGSNYALQQGLIQALDENSLALIISSYGNFFTNNSQIFDQILQTNCTTALLTQQNLFVSASLDHVFTINSKSYQKIGSYSMNFFIDFLCRKYFDTVSLHK